MTLREVFIQNLKYYRKQNGIRQLDLAMEIGKSSNYINSIENGKYFPSPETIEEIANIFNIEPMELFNEHVSKECQIHFKQESLQNLEKHLVDSILEDIKSTFSLLNDSKIE